VHASEKSQILFAKCFCYWLFLEPIAIHPLHIFIVFVLFPSTARSDLRHISLSLSCPHDEKRNNGIGNLDSALLTPSKSIARVFPNLHLGKLILMVKILEEKIFQCKVSRIGAFIITIWTRYLSLSSICQHIVICYTLTLIGGALTILSVLLARIDVVLIAIPILTVVTCAITCICNVSHGIVPDDETNDLVNIVDILDTENDGRSLVVTKRIQDIVQNVDSTIPLPYLIPVQICRRGVWRSFQKGVPGKLFQPK